MTSNTEKPNALLVEYKGNQFDFKAIAAVSAGQFVYVSGDFGVSPVTNIATQKTIGIALSSAAIGEQVSVRIFANEFVNCVITGGTLAAGSWVKPNGNKDTVYPYPEVVAIAPVTDPKEFLLVVGNTANNIGLLAIIPQGYIVGA